MKSSIFSWYLEKSCLAGYKFWPEVRFYAKISVCNIRRGKSRDLQATKSH